MAKKETQAKKSESRTKNAAARPSDKPNKKPSDEAVKEFMGVHVINNRDIENHFGASEIKTGGESVQPATNRPKVDVNLHLDEQVWQEAQAAAAQMGLELPQYVETALKRFKDDSAR